MHLFHILGEGMAIWRKSTSVITVSYVLNQPFFHETHFDLKEWQTGYRDSNLVDIFLKWKKKKKKSACNFKGKTPTVFVTND